MKLRHLVLITWLSAISTLPPAHAGYLVDSGGTPVRNSYGQCWRTGSWTPAQASAECDPDLVRQAAHAERPAPVAAPAPRVEAPIAAPAAPPPPAKAKKKQALKKNGGGLAELLKPSAVAAPPAGEVRIAVHIQEHHWAQIRHKGDEARNFSGFGMYSYVLFGRNPTDPDLNGAVRARYDALLAAVRQLPLETGKGAAALRRTTNIFCIPAGKPAPTLDRNTYDFALAQQYLADFRFLLAGDKDILPRLVNGSGPFLIATLRPLDGIVRSSGSALKIVDARAPLLFVDLTHTHPQVIAEMVDAFKGEVIDTKMDRKKRFRSLRVALIDLLKQADDQVTPIREAVAGFMPKEK